MNAGPLIHLSWIDHLDLFPALFEEVLVPLAVQDEVLRASPDVPGLPALQAAFASEWLKVRAVTDRTAVTRLTSDLDLGESEAIVLMREVGADLLLLDERRGREIADRQGLPIMGTIGILRTARNRGLIPAVTPLLEELRRREFRVSTQIAEKVRREEAMPLTHPRGVIHQPARLRLRYGSRRYVSILEHPASTESEASQNDLPI